MFYLVFFSTGFYISIIIYAYSDLGYIFIAYYFFIDIDKYMLLYYYEGKGLCPKRTEGTLSPPSSLEFKKQQ